MNTDCRATVTTASAARERAAVFLKRHRMHHTQIDAEAELSKFLNALEEDYRLGGKTGRMIPTWVGDYKAPAEGERAVTVIDIGGTNVRCAVIAIGPEGVRRIENLLRFRTPGVAAAVDTAGFYGKIVEGVRDNLVTDEIGICFSLATIPQRDRDAVMVAGGKQIKIRDMLGKKVGESFRSAMKERGLDGGARITVINDTVAAALGGQAAVSAEKAGTYRSFLGFIYGTGINMCYREQSGEWINTETAAYDTFPTGDLDDEFDAGLIDPGGDRLEKMVSGGYQGGLMSCILRAAAREGVLSPQTDASLRESVLERSRLTKQLGRKTLSTRDLSAFSGDPRGDNLIAAACRSEADRELIKAVCDNMTRRSARICAVVLTAGLLRSGAGVNGSGPAFITAEGSTYLKQIDFRERLADEMEKLAGERYGLSWEFHTVPDVILRGIAVACLSE